MVGEKSWMRRICVVRVDESSKGCYISMGSRSDVKSNDGALCVAYASMLHHICTHVAQSESLAAKLEGKYNQVVVGNGERRRGLTTGWVGPRLANVRSTLGGGV